ncbi:MAG: tryptophan 7-halogenase [Kangiellaceae bacterium]|nr:tryptophan 7-halogenase [Kangiellaceae bacterium]MCW9018602.1 tryptophan 7-halogenase [Kangiellaceae bacterium]
MKHTSKHHYDVCIIGGGPAGLATALMLRQHNKALTIAVVEKSNYNDHRVGESVAPGLEAVLKALGAEELLNANKHQISAGVISYWGTVHPQYQDYLLYPRGKGWHLNRTRFDADLAALCVTNDIDVYCGYRFQNSHSNQGERRLFFNSTNDTAEFVLGEKARTKQLELTTKFTIDASGRAAKFTLQQDSRTRHLDSMLAIYGIFDDEPSPIPYSTILPIENGWWYSAPLPEDKKIIALMTDRDLAKEHQLTNQAHWFDLLQKSPQVSLFKQSLNSADGLQIWPAYSLFRDKIIGQDWLSVGDTAMCFDPLSSQGILKSMLHGCYAAHAVHDYFLAKNDPDKAISALKKYNLSCGAAFNSYYSTWCEFYRSERRWPESSFWKRRYNPLVQLSPYDTLLVNSDRQSVTTPFCDKKLIQQLLSTCYSEKQVWRIVNKLKSLWNQAERFELSGNSELPEHFKIPDELIINQLQALVSNGMLTQVADSSDRQENSNSQISSHV